MVVFGCFDCVVVVLLFWVLHMLFLGCYALVCIAYAAILVCFVTLVGGGFVCCCLVCKVFTCGVWVCWLPMCL